MKLNKKVASDGTKTGKHLKKGSKIDLSQSQANRDHSRAWLWANEPQPDPKAVLKGRKIRLKVERQLVE